MYTVYTCRHTKWEVDELDYKAVKMWTLFSKC